MSNPSTDLRSGPAFDSFRKFDDNPLSGVKKSRLVRRPNAKMALLQRVLKEEIRKLQIPLPYATAVAPGSTLMGHVTPHLGHQFLVQYDLQGAFGSVQAQALRQIFSAYGRAGRWIGEVAVRYAMIPGEGLITGAAAAPDLFNVYAGMLIDQRLNLLLMQWGDVSYTRYVDDLVFSSERPIGLRRRRQILEVIRSAGFALSDGKTKITDLVEDGLVHINGVSVTLTGKISISRSYKRALYRQILLAENDIVSIQSLAGRMGAFYAVIGKLEGNMSASELRIHRRYQRLIAIWRADPARAARRAARRRAYWENMGSAERAARQKKRRQRGPRRRRRRKPRPWTADGAYKRTYGKPSVPQEPSRPTRRKDRRAPHRQPRRTDPRSY